jgi:hypothetical protein
MKKLALSTILLVVTLSQAFTQDSGDQKFVFGLKASPSVTWFRVDGDGIKNEAIRIGFTYGLMTEFYLTSNYAFATGIDISYRGGKYKEQVSLLGNVLGNVDVIQKLQFVEVPIALKLKTNEIGYMKYYGIFGVSPGVIVKANETIESDILGFPDRKNRSNQSDFTVFNTSLNVGLGIEYNLGGSTSFTTGLQYTNGLIDIWSIDKRQMRSDGITLNIGVLF